MPKQDPQQQSAPRKQPQPYMDDHEAPASPELTQAVQQIADSAEAKPTKDERQQAPEKSNSQIEAERNITRRLMEASLQEIRILVNGEVKKTIGGLPGITDPFDTLPQAARYVGEEPLDELTAGVSASLRPTARTTPSGNSRPAGRRDSRPAVR